MTTHVSPIYIVQDLV